MHCQLEAGHVRIAARMAQKYRQAQRQQLRNEGAVIKVHIEFAKFAPVSEHQKAEPVQLGQAKTNCICVVQNVGPVLVVIAVRNLRADFMQLRGPVELSQMALFVFADRAGLAGLHLREQPAGDPGHAGPLRGIHCKPRAEAFDGNPRQIRLLVGAAHQVVDQAVPQAAIGVVQHVDLKQVKQGPKNAKPPANDGPPVIFHAGDPQAVRALGLKQLFKHPVQALAAHRPGSPTGRSQHVAHCADGARRTIGHVPSIASIGVERFIEHRLGRDFSRVKCVGGELPLREIPA